MGVVYRAFDPKLGREVALKALLQPAGDDEERARFLNEGRTAERVEHPHVLAVHGVGVVEPVAHDEPAEHSSQSDGSSLPVSPEKRPASHSAGATAPASQ